MAARNPRDRPGTRLSLRIRCAPSARCWQVRLRPASAHPRSETRTNIARCIPASPTPRTRFRICSADRNTTQNAPHTQARHAPQPGTPKRRRTERRLGIRWLARRDTAGAQRDSRHAPHPPARPIQPGRRPVCSPHGAWRHRRPGKQRRTHSSKNVKGRQFPSFGDKVGAMSPKRSRHCQIREQNAAATRAYLPCPRQILPLRPSPGGRKRRQATASDSSISLADLRPQGFRRSDLRPEACFPAQRVDAAAAIAQRRRPCLRVLHCQGFWCLVGRRRHDGLLCGPAAATAAFSVRFATPQRRREPVTPSPVPCARLGYPSA